MEKEKSIRNLGKLAGELHTYNMSVAEEKEIGKVLSDLGYGFVFMDTSKYGLVKTNE